MRNQNYNIVKPTKFSGTACLCNVVIFNEIMVVAVKVLGIFVTWYDLTPSIESSMLDFKIFSQFFNISIPCQIIYWLLVKSWVDVHCCPTLYQFKLVKLPLEASFMAMLAMIGAKSLSFLRVDQQCISSSTLPLTCAATGQCTCTNKLTNNLITINWILPNWCWQQGSNLRPPGSKALILAYKQVGFELDQGWSESDAD